MPRAILLRAAFAAALGLSLTACAAMDSVQGPADPKLPYTGSKLTPTEQFGVNVSQTPDRIQLLPRAGALSAQQVGALTELARRWQVDGQGSVRIETPAGGQNAAVASQAAYAAQQVLQGAGVFPAAITLTAYNATGQVAPTVSVGFSRYVAEIPKCSDYVGDMTKTGTNEPYRSYGCAVTANFAAQLADPGDILSPKTEGAPDTVRRAVVLDTYRKGKPTGTPRAGNPAESSQASDF